ncbi:hypothetical protein [Mycobacteroides chelonae]|uniref:hypothetical protein n=3 Tax=Mycobacteriaceae TaxID=1762 RepID=UPI0007128AF0|nr:hypothetical protein [Mycobacteroides chelonae]KRQ31422.1 hypothetical protein AOT86_02105 [Mycobacteroides sp. H072]KRQ50641.1 hypothetical protein AOT85_14225 [Mycobacteroides sp. H054]
MTRAERFKLSIAVMRQTAQVVAGRMRLAQGKLPAGAEDIDVREFVPPDSRLAREVEAACAEQPELLIGHSYRAWIYGLALAAVDRAPLDRELFYCAALVHDWGIAVPVPGEDFVIRGADRALECARNAELDPLSADLIADGICGHETPGATIEHDGAIAYYVQHGAMVDVVGIRAWDIAPRNIENVLQRHPREADFKRQAQKLVKNEAIAVPKGRFGLLDRYGMTRSIALAPFES